MYKNLIRKKNGPTASTITKSEKNVKDTNWGETLINNQNMCVIIILVSVYVIFACLIREKSRDGFWYVMGGIYPPLQLVFFMKMKHEIRNSVFY